MAHIALVTLGSAGDIHPMLALAVGLQARGHAVRLLTSPAFEALAQRAGVPFFPIGAATDLGHTLQHPKLWHPVDGLGVMWRYLLRPALLPTLAALAGLRRQGELDLVVASPVAMGARAFQEASGVPLVSVYTAATLLRTAHAPMTLAQSRLPGWAPRPLVRAAWHLLDRYKLEPLVREGVHGLRAYAGLPPLAPATRVWADWMHSPHTGVTLFPDWFAPAPSDWPAQVQVGGFVMFDGDQVGGGPAGLTGFLEQGPPPLVFMPGSAMRQGADFYRAALAASHALGRRAVLLGNVPDGLVPSGATDVWVGPYAPFGPLLPRAAALVHHGGVGSTAQALRAGIPQVVVPRAYDQFDNAMRVEALGVGRRCAHSRAAPLQLALAEVLGSPRVAARCRQLATRMADEDGLARSCSHVEAALAERQAHA